MYKKNVMRYICLSSQQLELKEFPQIYIFLDCVSGLMVSSPWLTELNLVAMAMTHDDNYFIGNIYILSKI